MAGRGKEGRRGWREGKEIGRREERKVDLSFVSAGNFGAISLMMV